MSVEFDLPIERHPELYLLPGDVVLVARTSPNTDDLLSEEQDDAAPKYWLFRVHKFMLSHHSVAFANLFADANAASGDIYDGVPLVRMEGDRAQDLALLLTYLYYPTYYVFRLVFSHSLCSHCFNTVESLTLGVSTLTSRLC